MNLDSEQPFGCMLGAICELLCHHKFVNFATKCMEGFVCICSEQLISCMLKYPYIEVTC